MLRKSVRKRRTARSAAESFVYSFFVMMPSALYPIFKTISSEMYNIIVLNTICSATKERQEEAHGIAKRVEAMLVIGDRNPIFKTISSGFTSMTVPSTTSPFLIVLNDSSNICSNDNSDIIPKRARKGIISLLSGMPPTRK